jgi:hypothetical protein
MNQSLVIAVRYQTTMSCCRLRIGRGMPIWQRSFSGNKNLNA